MILAFIWVQGSWKWTQARLLSEKFWFKILEMWQELRNIWNSDSPLWQEIKKTIEAGFQVSPEIVWKVIKESIWDKLNEDLILDGFIRNEWNKNSVDELTKDYKVVLFSLDKEKAITRLLWRMYDPETWDTFPAWTEINAKNGNKLIKRHDDNEEAILNRINAFYDITLPIVDIFKSEWKVIEVNADQSVEDVFYELVKKLMISC
jgi:adenylate kinase family enzyme